MPSFCDFGRSCGAGKTCAVMAPHFSLGALGEVRTSILEDDVSSSEEAHLLSREQSPRSK